MALNTSRLVDGVDLLNPNIRDYEGGSPDYTEGGGLDDWEGDTDNDLVSAQICEVLEVYTEVPEANLWDDDLGYASGGTYNANYRRGVRAASGHAHAGIPADDGTMAGFRQMETAGARIFYISNTYFFIEDIITYQPNATSGNAFGIDVGSSGDNFRAVAHIDFNGGSAVRGLRVGSGADNSFIINSLVFGDKDGIIGGGVVAFVNCAAIDNDDDGFENDAGTIAAYNCLADGNGQDDYDGVFTMTTCGSEDNTGTVGLRGLAWTYVGGNDYHHAADSAALNVGTDGEGVYGFNDDIDGEERTGDWDLGFDEYVAATTTTTTTPAPTTTTPAPTTTTVAPTTTTPAPGVAPTSTLSGPLGGPLVGPF